MRLAGVFLQVGTPVRLTVVIPTYNEAANVGPMAGTLFGLGIPGLDILIVDGSFSFSVQHLEAIARI